MHRTLCSINEDKLLKQLRRHLAIEANPLNAWMGQEETVEIISFSGVRLNT